MQAKISNNDRVYINPALYPVAAIYGQHLCHLDHSCLCGAPGVSRQMTEDRGQKTERICPDLYLI